MSNANKIARIKDPVRTLRLIQKVKPSAIIAGGYYRDIFNDVQYGGVDIYVSSGSTATHGSVFDGNIFDPDITSHWEDLLELKVHDFRSMDMIQELGEGDEDYDIDGTQNIVKVFGMIKSEIQYNIIVVVDEPIKFIEEDFDFNICKTYCDGKKIRFTKEFMSDAESKTITFGQKRKTKMSQFCHAMDIHLPKLQRKYPQHKLVIPESHQEIYKQYQTGWVL